MIHNIGNLSILAVLQCNRPYCSFFLLYKYNNGMSSHFNIVDNAWLLTETTEALTSSKC